MPNLYRLCPKISIHALREEGDLLGVVHVIAKVFISIHALREEGDIKIGHSHSTIRLFQSTPSARRATMINMSQVVQTSDFNPRPPRGGRLPDTTIAQEVQKISIHALREEGDETKVNGTVTKVTFQSTPSARRATDTRLMTLRLTVFQSTPSARRAT